MNDSFLNKTLNICEIFYSIQGESLYSGYPCIFIRTSGCNLDCSWCDSRYANLPGKSMSFSKIWESIKPYGKRLVCLTGGEPLIQPESLDLIDLLIQKGYKVILETNGSLDISKVNKDTHIVLDIKCPDSQMSKHNLLSNIEKLKEQDEIKFVVSSRSDFDWAKSLILNHPSLTNRASNFFHTTLLISGVSGHVDPKDLVEWIKEESEISFKLNLQIHKYIWDPNKRGV